MGNTTGPFYPTVGADGGGGTGAAWTSISNVYVSDGLYASADISSPGYYSSYLKTSGYGFTIPPTAIIEGIVLEVQHYGVNAADASIQLLKAGTVSGTDRVLTQAVNWPGSEAYATYGGIADLWGTTWTPSDINNANFGAQIQVYNTHGGGSAFVDTMRITVYWHTAPADVPKRYAYRACSRTGTYLGMLPNVSSEFSVSREINTAGSQITIECGLSIDTSALQSVSSLTDEAGAVLTDEAGNTLTTEGAASLVGAANSGALIANGNEIVVTEYGYYYPNGRTVFRGQVQKVTASFGGSAGDTVKLLVYSDGFDMDNYILTGPPFAYTLDQSQTSQNSSAALDKTATGAYDNYGQTFTTGAGVTNIGAISLYLNGTGTVTVTLYSSTAMTNVMASSTVNVSVGSPTEVQFGFNSRVAVTASTQYFFTVTIATNQSVTIYYQNTNIYSGGSYYVANYAGGGGGGSFGADTAKDLYFKTFSSNGNTTATFSTQDPSTGMLVSIMSDYASRGGKMIAGVNTITATGLSLTYQFVTATVYEGLKAVLSLAPNGFYYYADVGTNTLYFKQASTSADILLVKDKHIESIDLGLTIEHVKNFIPFSGGIPAGTSTNLFRLYQDAASIASFGQRLDRKSDNRVTLTATADAIGNSAIAENKDEMYETKVTVVDKTMDTSLLNPGLIVGFRGFGSFVDNLLLQIVRVDYTPEEATLTLGILPKRTIPEFERLTRGLIAEQTIDNPTAPS